MSWRKNGDLIRERGRRFLSDHALRSSWASFLRIESSPVELLDIEFEEPSDSLILWASYLTIESMPVEWLAIGFEKPYDSLRFDYRKWSRAHPERVHENENGRPRNEASRAAATLALRFYDAWRRENEREGIKDYGHRGEMKDFAARAIVEDIYALQFDVPKLNWQFAVKGPTDFIELVHDLMNKPKDRRDAGPHAEFHYLASPKGLAMDLPPKPPQKGEDLV